MSTSTKFALVVVPPCLFPLAVFLLARRPTESPFGNAFAMLPVMALGGVSALGYGCVALKNWRAGRGQRGVWLIAALVAVSPVAYFVLWNLFFREQQF